MPQKAVGGRAVTEQMGAASAALLEQNERWIAYLRWRKSEAETRLRASGDLDEALAALGGSPTAGRPDSEADGASGGLSPWATGGLAGPPAGSSDLAAWELPGDDALPPAEDQAGLWASWAAAGEGDAEAVEGGR
jgi:hypothetical protein